MDETLRKRIIETLLTEKDNRDKIKKIGLSQDIADWAHEISNKLSLTVANMLKDKYESEMANLDNKISIEAFKDEYTEDFRAISDLLQRTPNRPPVDVRTLTYDEAIDLVNKYRYISDWLNHPESTALAEFGPGFLTKKTWDEAIAMADEFHQNLTAGGDVEDLLDEKDEIFHEFGDGFMWVLRKDRKCGKGAKSMGHCGTASKPDMFLLRLIKGSKEFITADWHPQDKYIMQLKGLKNKKPLPAYHPYIIWLIREWDGVDKLKTHEGYLPHTNFQLGDLDPKVAAQIIGENPNIQPIRVILNYTPTENKAALISNLFKYDSFLNKLIPNGFSDFFKLVDDKSRNSVIGAILKHPDFFTKMGKYQGYLTDTLTRLISGTQYKDKLIESLLNIDGLIDMLDVEGEDLLVDSHSDPEKIRDILLQHEFGGDFEGDDDIYDIAESHKRKARIIKELRNRFGKLL